ncbi:MAG: AlpA family phage regulatory protein [Rhodobacteraceae bacterium]|nr:AlpA family phage regulatory protein [Paracoccaceae bacterium]
MYHEFSPKRMLRAKEALRKLGVGKTKFYQLTKSDGFPKPVALGARARGYYEHELEEWLAAQPRA